MSFKCENCHESIYLGDEIKGLLPGVEFQSKPGTDTTKRIFCTSCLETLTCFGMLEVEKVSITKNEEEEIGKKEENSEKTIKNIYKCFFCKSPVSSLSIPCVKCHKRHPLMGRKTKKYKKKK